MLVAAGIVLALALLLACPVRVSAAFGETLSVTVRYLFLRFRLLPQKEKPEKPGRRKKPEKKKEEEAGQKEEKKGFRDILKERGVGGVLHILSEAASLAASVLKKFFSHVHVTRFDLFLVIASKDAAETALLYGEACAAAYPAVGALMQACGCSRFGVSVVPDFQREKPEVRLRFRARISLFFILKEGVSALFRAAKLWQKLQPEPPKEAGASAPSKVKSS